MIHVDASVVVWSCLGVDKYCVRYVGSDPRRYWTWGRSDIYPTSQFSAGRRSRTG